MRQRLNRSKYWVTVLLSIEILAGLVLLYVTTYFHCILIAFLPKSERQVLLSQMANIFLLGAEIVICFSIEFYLWKKFCKKDSFVGQERLLILWNIFCTLAVGFGTITVWFQDDNIESLQRGYATSLFEGIDLYFTDPDWKLLWDRIQFYNECCGVFGMKDWQEAEWIPEDQECLEGSGSIHPMTMVPYACCKRSSTSCFQSFSPQSGVDNDVHNELGNINNRGCFQIFKSITEQFLHVVYCVWIVIIMTQILILALMYFIIFKSDKSIFYPLDGSEDTTELPLVVVKCPRNVRCITLTDEDSFCDEEEEIEKEFQQRCSNCHTVITSLRQEVFETDNKARQNIFVH